MLQACLLNASKGSLLPASGIMLWLWQAALLRAAAARCLTETGMTGFPETPLLHCMFYAVHRDHSWYEASLALFHVYEQAFSLCFACASVFSVCATLHVL